MARLKEDRVKYLLTNMPDSGCPDWGHAVNLRGLPGAGKTHLSNRIIEEFPVRIPFGSEEFRPELVALMFGIQDVRPLAYLDVDKLVNMMMFKEVEKHWLFKIINSLLLHGWNVLFDGAVLYTDVDLTAMMCDKGLMTVVHLTTPMDQCNRQVAHRQELRGKEAIPYKDSSMRHTEKRINKGLMGLRHKGVHPVSGSYNEVLEFLRRTFGLVAPLREAIEG